MDTDTLLERFLDKLDALATRTDERFSALSERTVSNENSIRWIMLIGGTLIGVGFSWAWHHEGLWAHKGATHELNRMNAEKAAESGTGQFLQPRPPG